MLNFDAFAQNIRDAVGPRAVGFTFAIHNGSVLQKSGSGGFAKTPVLPQNSAFKMNSCSMSKTITAAAVVKALMLRSPTLAANISGLIEPFLPNQWDKGFGVSQLKFLDLLTHNSGLLPSGAPLDADLSSNLQNSIAVGKLQVLPKYQNINFSLFRIILPRLVLSPFAIQIIESLATTQYLEGAIYSSFVREQIFKPCGVFGVDIRPIANPPTVRYYNFHNSSDYVEDQLDPSGNKQIYRCGPMYWYMSAIDYGAFLAGLIQGKADPPGLGPGKLGIWTRMTSNLLGMNMAVGELGTYYFHDGKFFVGDAGARTAWVAFPNGVNAVLMVNSLGGFDAWSFPVPVLGMDILAKIDPGSFKTVDPSMSSLLIKAHEDANS